MARPLHWSRSNRHQEKSMKTMTTITSIELHTVTGGAVSGRFLANHPFAAAGFLAHHPLREARFDANHPIAGARIDAIQRRWGL
jgi:hypothetical protein